MKNKRKNLLILLFLIFMTILIAGISYALLTKNIIGSSNKVVYKIGDLEVKIDETGAKDISLTNAIPQEDSEGLSNEPYSFSLVNNATTDLKYTIYLEDNTEAKNSCGTNCELVPYNFVKYNLSSDSTSLKKSTLSSSSTELYTGTIKSKTTDKFNLRVWLSIDADNTAMNKYYFGKIKVVINQGDDYCIRNGFNTLSDCMLVMNNHESTVDTAKTNIKAKGTPDFSKTATTDEGLFMAEDDEGESYYYRGAVKNNYVSFAGFIWRIIRRNGDGSIRMIYSGKSTSDTGDDTMIGYSKFNDKYWDPTYVGYKYNEDFSLHENNSSFSMFAYFNNTSKYDFGTSYIFDETTKKFTLTGDIKQLTWNDDHDEIVNNQLYSCLNTNCYVIYKIVKYDSDTRMTVVPVNYGSNNYQNTLLNTIDSTIKQKIDQWYEKYLINYFSYLADEIFCNDRSVEYGSGYKIDDNTFYNTYKRNAESLTPSLKCSQMSDQFKISNESAKLDYPIALITADEVTFAGGRSFNDSSFPNKEYYLFNNDNYWTMSPSIYGRNYSTNHLYNTIINSSLHPWNKEGGSVFGIRPVINLRANTLITKGDGTSLNPYVIK